MSEGKPLPVPPAADEAFEAWWSRYWKNRTDTFEHTVARMIARDSWHASRSRRKQRLRKRAP